MNKEMVKNFLLEFTKRDYEIIDGNLYIPEIDFDEFHQLAKHFMTPEQRINFEKLFLEDKKKYYNFMYEWITSYFKQHRKDMIPVQHYGIDMIIVQQQRMSADGTPFIVNKPIF